MLISAGLDKAKRSRGDHRTLTCPFFECLKEFAETGNLKTHLRTHVSTIKYSTIKIQINDVYLDRRTALYL
jgi:hypothetical protein